MTTIEYILPSAKQPEPECAEPQRPTDRPPLLCKRALANAQTHTRAHAWECTRGWPVVCRRAMSDRVGFDFDLMLTRARALSLQTGTQHFIGSGADGDRGRWFCVYHKALYHKVLTCVCMSVSVYVELLDGLAGFDGAACARFASSLAVLSFRNGRRKEGMGILPSTTPLNHTHTRVVQLKEQAPGRCLHDKSDPFLRTHVC